MGVKYGMWGWECSSEASTSLAFWGPGFDFHHHKEIKRKYNHTMGCSLPIKRNEVLIQNGKPWKH